MSKHIPYPLIRLFFPFTAGILTAIYSGYNRHIPTEVFAAIVLTTAFYVFYFARKISYKTRWVYGVLLYAIMACCGYELTLQRTPALATDHFLNLSNPSQNLLVRICAPPQIRDKSVKAEAEMLLNGDSAKAVSCTGQLMLYLVKDSAAMQLAYGDLVLLHAIPERVAPPANPGAFDYQTYLANRGVYHQVFARNNDWKRVGVGQQNPLYALAYRARSKILGIFSDNHLEGREFAVTSALLVGYTDKLDADLLNDYSGTGAMHILSVSGMHVGLIYAVLNLLLFFFDKMRYGKIPKALLLLIFIWAYAIISGLSPSVLRAAAMFSLIVLGNSFNQSSDIFNNLAASAMVLLMINPYFITDMGFQLSYVAVIGIVALQPAISAWWVPKSWLLKQGWSITSVSIAAQLATFPLGLYYFHQFPNYFLLTNIVALPLSTAIIYFALVVLAVSFFPALSVILAKMLSWMVLALNTSISWIEGLPGSVTRGAFISGYETLCIYAIILCVLWYLFSRKKRALFASLVMSLLLCISFLYHNVMIEKQNLWVVYDAGKSPAMDFIRQRERLILADSVVLTDGQKIDYASGGLMESRGIRHFSGMNQQADFGGTLNEGVFKYHSFIQFLQHRVALVRCREESSQPLVVDYVVLGGNVDMSISEVLQNYQTGMIIIDATNSQYKANAWLLECQKLKVSCWSVPNSGAFVLE